MSSYSDLKSSHAAFTRAADLAQEGGDIERAIVLARQAVAIKKQMDIRSMNAGFHLATPARVH